MKYLLVAVISLTLSIPLCSSRVQGQPEEDQTPGGGQCPPQRVNNSNNMNTMADEAYPSDNQQGHPGGGPGMNRQTKSDTDSEIDPVPTGGGNRLGGSPGNGPPGGGFRRFGGPGQGGTPQEMAERRQRMMKRFDTNGDGVLDDNERAKMRAFMQQRRQERENRPNGGGDFPNDSSPRQSEPQ